MKHFLALICVCLPLLVACEKKPSQKRSSAVSSEPFIVQCDNSLPEFSLGYDSNPSNAAITELCGCIWGELGSWEKQSLTLISQGREQEVSKLNLRALPSRFGKAVESCGGMDL